MRYQRVQHNTHTPRHTTNRFEGARRNQTATRNEFSFSHLAINEALVVLVRMKSVFSFRRSIRWCVESKKPQPSSKIYFHWERDDLKMCVLAFDVTSVVFENWIQTKTVCWIKCTIHCVLVIVMYVVLSRRSRHSSRSVVIWWRMNTYECLMKRAAMLVGSLATHKFNRRRKTREKKSGKINKNRKCIWMNEWRVEGMLAWTAHNLLFFKTSTKRWSVSWWFVH